MQRALGRFLNHLNVERGFSPATVAAYRLDLEKGFVPFLGRRDKNRYHDVTKEDVRAYLDYLAHARGNSSAARARKLSAIRSLFNYLVENEGLPNNPAASIRSPKIAEKEPCYLTDEECFLLLDAVSRRASPRNRKRDMAIVMLFLHTGARVSELVNLKLNDVDLASGFIRITRKRNKEQHLHLNAEAVKALAKYKSARLKAQDGRFFVTGQGKDLNRAFVYALVRKYLELAEIRKDKKGPHLLRHTFCTRLHRKGVTPFVIRDLAGHKSLATTMRYVNIEKKEQAEAVDKLVFGLAKV
ncbi:MAG: tyrosine-type recombinase/integrase [Chloroflexi bacterium]|nr:tyrosine-type recombinase/integrase [Chloroflexota bacterium]